MMVVSSACVPLPQNSNADQRCRMTCTIDIGLELAEHSDKRRCLKLMELQ